MCLKCKKTGHEPLTCALFKEWDDNLAAVLDTLNNNWKKNNTKDCPQCKTGIEKNQGCMHMTCAKCKYEFCWLCMGDWKKHGSGTGGYFKCNIYKPENNDDMGAEYIKRLQFFTDRYLEHKRGLEITDDKIKALIKLVEDKKSSFHHLNTQVTPGSLNFYIEAFKFLSKCRSFVVYTYPIGFKIMEQNAADLFAQTQYFLEYSLEKFDKNLQNNNIDMLMDQNQFGVCLSKNYSNIKVDIQTMQLKLGEQFKNAKNEFSDRDYLMVIDLDFKQKQNALKSCKLSSLF